MTRISDRHLVQNVDDELIVIIDEAVAARSPCTCPKPADSKSHSTF